MNKKNIFRKKWIINPIYRTHFWFCYGDYDKFIKFVAMKSKDQEVIDKLKDSRIATGKFVHTDDDIIFIWIQSKDLSVLVHELMHLVGRSLGECGLELCPPTEEAFAYYFEFLFKECRTFLNKKPIKRRNNNETKNVHKTSI